jgi:WD40 repeat protein
VAFPPDAGPLAATTANVDSPTGVNPDGVVIWDVASGAVRLRLAGDGPTNGVAWTPDGRAIVCGGGLLRNDQGDHDYRVWIADLGGRRQLVTGSHRNTVWSVAVSPDGRVVASASQDGSIMVTWTPRGSP